MAFKKAQRKAAKLRCSITGPSGSGKTYSALLLAKGIGGKVAVIDTEHGSASLYEDLVDFDVAELAPPFTPERYIALIQEASKDYDVLILDSITHEWSGEGGTLDIVNSIPGNSYMAWGKATPRHNAFIDALLRADCHLIATMRSKQDYVIDDKGGKKVPRKVGMAPVQREGMEYEFTLVLDIDQSNHLAVASKDRTRLFDTRLDAFKITEADGVKLREWLEAGVPEATEDKPSESRSSEIESTENAYKDALYSASNLDELKGLYKEAILWAKKESRDSMPLFLGIKDMRKSQLLADDQPAEADPSVDTVDAFFDGTPSVESAKA